MNNVLKFVVIFFISIILFGFIFVIYLEKKYKKTEEKTFEEKFERAIERLIEITRIISSCENLSEFNRVLICANEKISKKFIDKNIVVLDENYTRKSDEVIIRYNGKKFNYKIIIYKSNIIIDDYKYINFYINKDVEIYGLIGNINKSLCEKPVKRSDYFINDEIRSIGVEGLFLQTIARGIDKGFVKIKGTISKKNSCIYIKNIKSVEILNITKPSFILNIFVKDNKLVIVTPHPGHRLMFENYTYRNGIHKIFLKYIPPDPKKVYTQVLKKYEYELRIKGWVLVFVNGNLVFAKRFS